MNFKATSAQAFHLEIIQFEYAKRVLERIANTKKVNNE